MLFQNVASQSYWGVLDASVANRGSSKRSTSSHLGACLGAHAFWCAGACVCDAWCAVHVLMSLSDRRLVSCCTCRCVCSIISIISDHPRCLHAGITNLSVLLDTLLPGNMEAVDELLDEVAAGGIWQTVLAVPPPLSSSQAQVRVCVCACKKRDAACTSIAY